MSRYFAGSEHIAARNESFSVFLIFLLKAHGHTIAAMSLRNGHGHSGLFIIVLVI